MHVPVEKPIPLGAAAWCCDNACRQALDDAPIATDGAVDCPSCGKRQVLPVHLQGLLRERQRRQLGLFSTGVRG